MLHAFIELEYLYHKLLIIFELVEQFSRKLTEIRQQYKGDDVMDYVFSTPPGKGGKGSKIWGKYKLVMFRARRFKDPLKFCDCLSRLWDQFAQPFKQSEQENKNKN